MKTIVVGDIHGDFKKVEKALSAKVDRIVFVGDFLDSFEYSAEDQAKCIELVVQAKIERANVTVLMGNHELSYLYPDTMKASGFNTATARAVAPFIARISEFETFTTVDNFLVTHAGVSKTWLPEKTPDLNQVTAYLRDAPQEKLFEIGNGRGGMAVCGGPFWCDFWDEFTPIPRVNQIVGHSAYRPHYVGTGIQCLNATTSENWNVDALMTSNEVLLVRDNVAEVVDLVEL